MINFNLMITVEFNLFNGIPGRYCVFYYLDKWLKFKCRHYFF